MKVFVLNRKQAMLYSFACFLLISLLLINAKDAATAFSPADAGNIPIYSVEREDKSISITFDAAWEDGDTADIIAILAKYNARATIFVTGDFVDRCPESVKAFADAGHEIANHSDAHPHPNKISADALKSDTALCDEKIKAVVGKNVPLYRAPYGEYNDSVVKTIREMSYTFIQWDVDSLDYKGLSTAEITDRVCSRVAPGSIVLFHNGTENTAKALPSILKKLSDEGYTFLPISEMIYQDNYHIDHTGRQFANENAITSID